MSSAWVLGRPSESQQAEPTPVTLRDRGAGRLQGARVQTDRTGPEESQRGLLEVVPVL